MAISDHIIGNSPGHSGTGVSLRKSGARKVLEAVVSRLPGLPSATARFPLRTLEDGAAPRERQDFSGAVRTSAGDARRLHAIAETIRSRLPR